MAYLLKTQTLLDDVKQVLESRQLENDSPIINDYLVKIAVIIFSSEMENHLKDLISRKLGNYKNFCMLCNKLRNPNLKDINKILKDISLEPLDLSDEEIHKYSNVIEARNKIAHDPSYLHEITIGEIIEVLSIGKDILTKIESLVS